MKSLSFRPENVNYFRTFLLLTIPTGVSAPDPTVFIVVTGVLVSVGVFACWLPARQATPDPVRAIRYE